jgi:hypothetical protein
MLLLARPIWCKLEAGRVRNSKEKHQSLLTGSGVSLCYYSVRLLQVFGAVLLVLDLLNMRFF